MENANHADAVRGRLVENYIRLEPADDEMPHAGEAGIWGPVLFGCVRKQLVQTQRSRESPMEEPEHVSTDSE
jgi:hypothetical protein